MKPKVLVLHASGTNRDHEAARACELAGGAPEIVHINQLRGCSPSHRLADYQMLVIAGGFSYGDALGAGKRLALDLSTDLSEDLARFVEAGKPILGICNGFQALIKAGLLPDPQAQAGAGPAAIHAIEDQAQFAMREAGATLTHNLSGRFECRWTTLLPNPAAACVFTRELAEPIYCPVAHGEGRLVYSAPLPEALVALRYGGAGDAAAGADYPANPNGSFDAIAGVCNAAGTILGLMPHPEDHVVDWQHPRWTRGERGQSGLPLFVGGVRYAAAV